MTPFEAAICSKLAYDPSAEEIVTRLGFSYKAIQSKDHFAWVGERQGITVVAFRGTMLRGRETKSYRSNLSTDLVPWSGPGLVHEGYHKALWQIIAAIRREVKGRDNIVMTGHSMGGAMATLAAQLVSADRVHVFACPRLGNKELAAAIYDQVRVTRYVNRCDFLARLPFAGMIRGSEPQIRERYAHVGRAVRLPTFGHSMTAYVEGVKARKAR